jgi:uncharacterized protein (DUF433 family)
VTAPTIIHALEDIVSTPGICQGQPRIQGTRITVKFLATLIGHPDWPMEAICENFSLDPAQIHAAWAYYYHHRAEIEAQLLADRQAAAAALADPLQQAQAAKLKARAQP